MLDFVDTVEQLLFQLHDVGVFIDELVSSDKLLDNFDFTVNVLICACVEEKYIMKLLETYLNDYMGFSNHWFGFFRVRVGYDYTGGYYLFKFPRLTNYSGQHYICLTHLLSRVKGIIGDTGVYDYDIYGDMVKQNVLLLECKHHSFNTDNFLYYNHIIMDFEIK